MFFFSHLSLMIPAKRRFATKIFGLEMTPPPVRNFSENSSVLVGRGFPKFYGLQNISKTDTYQRAGSWALGAIIWQLWGNLFNTGWDFTCELCEIVDKKKLAINMGWVEKWSSIANFMGLRRGSRGELRRLEKIPQGNFRMHCSLILHSFGYFSTSCFCRWPYNTY